MDTFTAKTIALHRPRTVAASVLKTGAERWSVDAIEALFNLAFPGQGLFLKPVFSLSSMSGISLEASLHRAAAGYLVIMAALPRQNSISLQCACQRPAALST